MTVKQTILRCRELRSSPQPEWTDDEWDTFRMFVEHLDIDDPDPTATELRRMLDCLRVPWMRPTVAAALVNTDQLDETFLAPLILAAVDQIDPSTNRWPVTAAIKHFGRRVVTQILLEMLKSGTSFEQSGASNALYWAQVGVRHVRTGDGVYEPRPTAEEQRELDGVADLWKEIDLIRLQLFVTSTSLDVQRSMIPALDVAHPERYPIEHRHLVDRAIAIARAHPDGYSRHRIEVQLGNELLLPPLPYRGMPVMDQSSLANELHQVSETKSNSVLDRIKRRLTRNDST